MIYVFWWSGRGYLTALIVLGSLLAFGLILQAAPGVFSDGPASWGVGLLASAILNWRYGSKANRNKIAALGPRKLRDRLLYRARNRFMSLPMESFSIVIAAAGLAMIVYSFLNLGD